MYTNMKTTCLTPNNAQNIAEKINKRIAAVREEYRKLNLEISEVEKTATKILQTWMLLNAREEKLLEGITEMEGLQQKAFSLGQVSKPNKIETDRLADEFETLNRNLQNYGRNIQISFEFNLKDAIKIGVVKFGEKNVLDKEDIDEVNIISRIPLVDLTQVQSITGLIVVKNMVMIVWHKTETDSNSYLTKITFFQEFSEVKSLSTLKFIGVEFYGIGLLSTGEIISTDNGKLIIIKDDEIVAKKLISGEEMNAKAYMRDIAILNDEIFATDIANHLTYSLRKDGKIVRYFGSGKLNHPMEVEVAENGRLLVRDVDGLKAFEPNGDLFKSEDIPNIKFRRGLSINEKGNILYVTEIEKNEVLKFFNFETLVQCNEIKMNKAYCIYEAGFLPNGNVVFVDEECDDAFHLKILKL